MNVCTFIGNLGDKPEVKRFPARDGDEELVVCKMRLAVDEFHGGAKGVLWLNVKAWGRTAESCGKHLDKGSRIALVGHLTVEEWEDKEGNKRAAPVIVADRVEFQPDGKGRRE